MTSHYFIQIQRSLFRLHLSLCNFDTADFCKFSFLVSESPCISDFSPTSLATLPFYILFLCPCHILHSALCLLSLLLRDHTGWMPVAALIPVYTKGPAVLLPESGLIHSNVNLSSYISLFCIPQASHIEHFQPWTHLPPPSVFFNIDIWH